MDAIQTIRSESNMSAHPQKITLTIVYDDKPSVEFNYDSAAGNESDALAEAGQKQLLRGVKMILISKNEMRQ